MDAELLTEREVSARYGISVPWLRRKRVERRGPAFLKVGERMVRYRRTDIEAFLERRLVRTDERDHSAEPDRTPGSHGGDGK